MADRWITNEDILTEVEQNLARVLKSYEEYVGRGIEFSVDGPVLLTPDKPNTARTTVTVGQGDNKLAKMYVILFLAGDGTGDAKTYKPGQLIVPEYLQFDNKPERVLPRKKDCEEEIFLPLFSLINGKVHDNIVSLEELTVDDVQNPKTIVKRTDLGLPLEEYRNIVNSVIGPIEKRGPYHQRTTGYEGGKRFGDPHAIHHRRDLSSMQVVGFISLEKGNPLIRIFDEVRACPHIEYF